MKTPFARNRSTGRNGRRGFTLVETLVAAVIFMIGFVGLTAMLLNASSRRGQASKRAVVGRIAFDEYTRITQPGYDFVPVPGAYARVATDENGRTINLTTTVINDCNGVANTTFAVGGMALPLAQPCCAGMVCCKTVTVVATSVLNPQQGTTITDTYTGFITRGCSL
jgi:type II secretory pathway pseudopilin PulG